MKMSRLHLETIHLGKQQQKATKQKAAKTRSSEINQSCVNHQHPRACTEAAIPFCLFVPQGVMFLSKLLIGSMVTKQD